MTHDEFKRLCRSTEDYEWVEQKDRDVTGGTITFEEIDKMNEIPSVDKVMISGLKQDTFDYFVRTQAYKFRAIMFWKNKLVEDWSLLSTLKGVEFIGFFHNQRIERLWDMTENVSLEGLYISDFTRLHSLDGIKNAPNLERLYFGDAVWNTSVLDDLKALDNSKLKEFNFGGKAIKDEDITIFTRMPNLEILDFRTNLYTTEQVAWLVAKLPNVKGYALQPYVKFENSNFGKDILICGKRKPFLSSTEDTVKIEKYVKKFEQLVQQFTDQDETSPIRS